MCVHECACARARVSAQVRVCARVCANVGSCCQDAVQAPLALACIQWEFCVPAGTPHAPQASTSPYIQQCLILCPIIGTLAQVLIDWPAPHARQLGRTCKGPNRFSRERHLTHAAGTQRSAHTHTHHWRQAGGFLAAAVRAGGGTAFRMGTRALLLLKLLVLAAELLLLVLVAVDVVAGRVLVVGIVQPAWGRAARVQVGLAHAGGLEGDQDGSAVVVCCAAGLQAHCKHEHERTRVCACACVCVCVYICTGAVRACVHQVCAHMRVWSAL